jgi:ribonuclease III
MSNQTQQAAINKLAERLSLKFDEPEKFNRSFIHRSYLNENRSKDLESNERLEFLGDAVLELVVTKYLFENFDYPEGELTALRSALVRGKNLSDIAESVGVHDCIFLSEGEKKNTGKARSLILANTFEAMIGNVYLENGLDEASRIIKDLVITKLDEIIKNKSYIDSKSYLQEKIQETRKVTPSYKMLSQDGPDHAKQFTVGVYIDDELVATGEGESKNKAEQQAASEAINKILN